MKRIVKPLFALLLAAALCICTLPLPAIAAQANGIKPGGSVLTGTAGYPTSGSIFAAGDTFYTWTLGFGGFDSAVSAADLNAGLKSTLEAAGARAFSVPAMADLFDGVYTPYNAATSQPATYALRFKPAIAATTALSGTFGLKWDSDTSATVNLTGRVFQSGAQNSSNRITGIEGSVPLARKVQLNGSAFAASELDDLDIAPGSYLLFEIDSLNFTWSNGMPGPTTNVTNSQISSGRITVRHVRHGGTGVIDDIVFETKSGKTYVRINFLKDMSATTERSFDITVSLHANGVRNRQSEVNISGVLRNPVVELESGQDYVDLSQGEVATTRYTHSNIAIYAGHGISVHTRLFGGRKYYCKANNEWSSADERVYLRYEDIEGIFNLQYANLSVNSSKVSFDLNTSFYVYDGSLNYLGTTRQQLPLAEKYYLASRRLPQSAGSGTSNSGAVSKPPVQQPGAVTPSLLDVSVASAQSATNAALISGTTLVAFKNAGNISLDALKAMTTAAGNRTLTVISDSTAANGGVDVRLTFNPAGRTAGMNLSAFTYSDTAKSVKASFESWFQGRFAAISFGQRTDFSQLVRVSAKVNLTGLNVNALRFISYDRAANTFRYFTPTYTVDANGYLVFDTVMAGDILITDRALATR